ncbi:MAG: pyridoxamine 5'-phosphate oxidase family protein [Acidobacteria bacterium]|nr:pyridoxamine 5'-phosphate oxidase family protein [Acidobacteriota bacterium]
MTRSVRRDVAALLQATRQHAFLATVDGDQPSCRVVAPFVDDDLNIWIVTFRESRKVVQIEQNPRICLSFLEIPGYTREANVYGQAVIVAAAGEKQRIWTIAEDNLRRYFPEGPDSENFCLLRVRVDRVEWRQGPISQFQVYRPRHRAAQ